MLNPEEGNIFCFNKPYTMTSFRLVSKVRGILCHKLGIKKMKVGHAGTLDPLATGVLIVCTGKATKQIDQLQAGTKEYVATLKLGATTPSFDMETEEDGTYPTSHITRELVEQTLQQFIGAIEQVPPTFSAVKIDGSPPTRAQGKGRKWRSRQRRSSSTRLSSSATTWTVKPPQNLLRYTSSMPTAKKPSRPQT